MFVMGMHITIETKQNGDVIDRYQSKLMDITKTRLYINYPVNEKTGRTSFLMDGAEIIVSFLANDGNIYKFDSKILSRKKVNLGALVIERPPNDELIKIQRREYLRVDTSLDVAIYPLDETKPPLFTITKDLSGGGLAVFGKGMEKVYQPGENIDITIVIPLDSKNYSYIFAKGEVIRSIHKSSSNGGIISLKFNEISDQSRDHIIKYCFKKQLEIRRRLPNYNM